MLWGKSKSRDFHPALYSLRSRSPTPRSELVLCHPYIRRQRGRAVSNGMGVNPEHVAPMPSAYWLES